MPSFSDVATSEAPAEEVWKLLYDPARFPEWWAGVGSVETDDSHRGYTMFLAGYPDFPMPQTLETSRDNGSVKISGGTAASCTEIVALRTGAFGWVANG